MGVHLADWAVFGVYCTAALGIGVYFTRRASQSAEDFFVAGRKLPWWVIGMSDVATYSGGGAAWIMLVFMGGFIELWFVWWICWAIWMPIVAVIWAKMWRRLGVVTTGELIEVRYGGRPAAVFRGVFAVYAYLAWATVVLGYGASWLAQTLSPILGWSEPQILLVFGGIALIYTLLSGLFAVAYSDVVQFGMLFAGAMILCVLAVDAAGGMEAVRMGIVEVRGADFLKLLPPGGRADPVLGNHPIDMVTLLVLVLQGLFFAGSPFAGEGFTAQRTLAAKDERHAVGGQMLNCVLSLVVRMIPLVPLGMVAVVMYPKDFEAPAQLWALMAKEYAPAGLLGLLFVGAIAGYMSSVDSVINWGSSFLLNDLYRRHIRPKAPAKEYVLFSRCVSVAMLGMAFLFSYLFVKGLGDWVVFINSVVIIFSLPLAWLKWFWWRLNIYGEAVGILVGFPLAYVIWFPLDFKDSTQHPFWHPYLLLFVSGWILILLVTLLTPPERMETLKRFYTKVRPMGFWGPVRKEVDPAIVSEAKKEAKSDLQAAFWGVVFCLSMLIAFVAICAGRYPEAALSGVVMVAGGYLYLTTWLKAIARQKAAGFAVPDEA